MTRLQRISRMRLLRFDGYADSDSIEYKASGLQITVGLFPSFSSGVPDVPKIEIRTAPGKPAPDKNPIDQVHHQQREDELGARSHCFVLSIRGGLLPAMEGDQANGMQSLVVLVDASGKVTKTVQTAWYRDFENMSVDEAINRSNFEAQAKKAEIKTVIHPVDETTYEHLYSIQISAPGGLKLEHQGNAKELKKKSILGIGGSYFKNASAWGNAVIFQDSNGNYLVTGKGQTSLSKPPNFSQALSLAHSININNGN